MASAEHEKIGCDGNRPALEVADILKRYGPDYREQHKLSGKQHSVLFNIEHCRTSEFGYHLDVCDQCDHSAPAANSCRDRHCPKCQGIARRRWVKARLADLLPIAYFHVVFTLPHKIFPVSLYNKELIYDLLFDCAAQTLLQFGKDPRHLGALIGFYGILHTWGGKMWQHLHLHFIVTGGGLNDQGEWVRPKYEKKFIFPVQALSEVFRGKFIDGLKTAYYMGKIAIPSEQKYLEHPENFEKWINELAGHKWVVFAKKPFKTPEDVVEYVGRYTHKIAITNHRLISMENGEVHFKYKDYRNNGKWEIAKLSAEEFIRRFLMHVVPSGFHRIRHYGLFANGKCKAKVQQIRTLLQDPTTSKKIPESIETSVSIGTVCPKCKKGIMVAVMAVTQFGKIILFGNRPDIARKKLVWDTS